MPVFAQFNFGEATTTFIRDEALGNGPQDGYLYGNASAGGGALSLNGTSAYAKLFAHSEFQLPAGTLSMTFTTSTDPLTAPQTVASRDNAGENAGSLRVEITPEHRLVISHEGAGSVTSFSTPPGFFTPGDTMQFSYSWDAQNGGSFDIVNSTTGLSHSEPVPPGLDMVMTGGNGFPWIIGAGNPSGTDPLFPQTSGYFKGEVSHFSISDSVDTPVTPSRDGIIYGTDGNDLIDHSYVDPDGDRVDAGDALVPGDGPDDDRIYAGAGNDTVYAGQGNDTVYGGAGRDWIEGGAGNDLIHGEAGADTIFGGAGRDTVYGGNGDDLIDTGNGLPLPDIGYPGFYPADGDPENDRDLIYGGAGNDTIRSGDDADTIFGGAGDDHIDAGFDADEVYGGAGNDTIIGGEGADTIYGEAGDDLIYGGLAGIDLLDIPDARDLRPLNNADSLYGGAGNDTIYGHDDSDSLFGDAGNDLLFGGIDNDALFGGDGNDTLSGDEGDDTVFGGAGADRIIVSEGADTVFGGGDRDVIVIGAGAGHGSVIDGDEEGDDFDTLDLSEAGPLRISYAADNPENGRVSFLDADGNEIGSLDFRNIENVIPCFTPGTLIATPKGEVPVESLRAGDRVITRDNGIQQIRWIGKKPLSAAELRLNAHLQPVLVKAHSLGNGLPERDMLVSPNHRLLVANDRTQLFFDEHEVLVAAKHLTGAQGIQQITSMGLSYIHFMCDRHEVVLSDGAWTESFQPGDYTLKGMGNAQRNEIFELFPDLKTSAGLSNYQAARRTLRRHEASLLRG